jgi:hypothetical protein
MKHASTRNSSTWLKCHGFFAVNVRIDVDVWSFCFILLLSSLLDFKYLFNFWCQPLFTIQPHALKYFFHWQSFEGIKVLSSFTSAPKVIIIKSHPFKKCHNLKHAKILLQHCNFSLEKVTLDILFRPKFNLFQWNLIKHNFYDFWEWKMNWKYINEQQTCYSFLGIRLLRR